MTQELNQERTPSRLLAEVAAILASSLDYEETLAAVARLAVPQLADWCAVDVYDDEGELRRLAVQHIDPDRIRLAVELAERYPPDPETPGGLHEVLRTGEPSMVRRITDEMLAGAARDGEHLRLLRALRLRSFLSVPLLARGRTLGAITFVHAESGREYGEADLELASGLADRAAVAIDNARLYRAAQDEIAVRMRSEAELRKSEERLRFILEASRTGTWDWDVRTGRVVWSDNMEAVHGQEPGSFRGSFDSFLETAIPEDRRGILDAIERARAEDGDYWVEYRSRRADGEIVWLEGRGRILKDEAGTAIGMAGICTDVTPRKRAELAAGEAAERMRSVVDHVVDGIVTIDASGTILTFNDAAVRMFGYAADEAIGRNVTMLMPEPWRSEHAGYIARFLETGEARVIGIGREVEGLRKDGERFPIDLAVSRFRRGGETYFTGILREITEQKRMEEALREKVRELAEADRRKDEFLAYLSHELRNPLAPILNAVEILRLEDPAGPRPTKYVDVIERQARQLCRIVDDLLDLSRITKGKIELRPEVVDPADLVERAAESAAPAFAARRIRFSKREPAEPLRVTADPARMEQVLVNLLNNAAKFSPEDGAVEIGVRRDGDRAVFHVSDDGVGIRPEDRERIFDLFGQVAVPGGDRGGIGIGLALVKGLVELHGGEVRVESEGPGCGCTFEVRLPLAAE